MPEFHVLCMVCVTTDRSTNRSRKRDTLSTCLHEMENVSHTTSQAECRTHLISKFQSERENLPAFTGR